MRSLNRVETKAAQKCGKYGTEKNGYNCTKGSGLQEAHFQNHTDWEQNGYPQYVF